MIQRMIKTFYLLYPRDFIARVQGYKGADYDPELVSDVVWDVIERYGCRDPAGVKRAMKKYDCQTVEELAEKLSYYHPERRAWHRFMLGIGRVVGGTVNIGDVNELDRLKKREAKNEKLAERVKRAVALHAKNTNVAR